MSTGGDLWDTFDPTACPVCGRDSCEDHLPVDDVPPGAPNPTRRGGLPAEGLTDAVDVAAEGRLIAASGVNYRVDGIVPDYGMVGMNVAYAKVGKTTFGQALGAAVATGRPFLDRDVRQGRVLVLAIEDPPEYSAWLARHLSVPRGAMTFWRRPLILDADGLNRIVTTVRDGSYQLVLIASWQAAVVGLVRDENDNAGAVAVVTRAKNAARETGVPWLIDAHSGKGEDQSDDADPTKALRGASSAAGAADYLLSLRYANGAFGTQRRLSGKGRFVSFAPILLDYDCTAGTFATRSESDKDAARETDWRLICETGAIASIPRSANEIARLSGLVPTGKRPGGQQQARIRHALTGRPQVGVIQEVVKGQKTTLYRLLEIS